LTTADVMALLGMSEGFVREHYGELGLSRSGAGSGSREPASTPT
jgi:hypothetical protein